MKKSVLVLLVSICLVTLGLAAQKTYAAAGWPSSGGCNSFDDNHFPYRFLCGPVTGSNNNDTETLSIGRASTISGSTNSDLIKPPGNIDLPPGSRSVDFAAGFDSSKSGGGIPRATGGTPAGVLVWIYVLPNNPSADIFPGGTWRGAIPNGSTSTVKGYTGSIDQCPGWGAKYGKVFNFDDNGGQEQSPAAYSPTANMGFENCHDYGAMAYWKLSTADMSTRPDLSNNFKFRVNLDNTKTGSFCIREEVSVIYYPGTVKDFPAFSPDDRNSSDQNYNANHVAKQSRQLCYQATATPPPTLQETTGSCVQFTRTGTSGTYNGFTKRTYVSTSGVNPEVVSGLSAADGTGGRTSNFLQHSTTNFFDGRGYLGADQAGKWSYIPSQPDIIIYWGDFYHYTGATTATKINGDWYPVPGTAGAQVHNCFHAACTISAVYGIGTPDNVVQAGQPYVAFITITNDNGSGDALPLFKDYFGAKLGVNSPAAPYGANPRDVDDGFPDRLYPGQSATMWYTDTAPASSTPFIWALDAYPDYHAGGASVLLGNVCTANGATAGGGGGGDGGGVKVYAPFSLTPHASLDMTPSEENPTNIAYRTWVNNSSAATVAVPQQSVFFERPGGAGQTNLDSSNTSGPWGPGDTNTLNGNRDPRPASAGDEYCDQIHLDFTAGLVGPAGPGDIIGQNTEATAGPTCRHVHNEPYVHVLGADASAGGGFGNGCTSTVSGINTYLSATGAQPVGSGAQFGAVSIGGINGFSSATLRAPGTPPLGSTGLTFGNSSVTGGAPPSPSLGGSLGGGHCVPDFFASKPAATPIDPSNNIDSATTNGTPNVINTIKFFQPGGGSQLKINNGGRTRALADRTTLTIFVDGDVHIKGNIVYANTNWVSIDNIPSFQLIVKGDIFIDSSVSQLDGLYVAQPNGGTGGNIYTCSSPSGAGYTAANSDLLQQCRKQLVVNGAFVAQKVFLSRSFGSLRNSYPGEHLGNVRPGSQPDCTDSGPAPVSQDCAAEIFNVSPEMLLAQPGTTAQSGPSTGKYDYITSLAPVL